MQFSDKLNFLMNITQTSNKELALEISVDRSLISLLRSGKRKMPRNQNYIKHMSLFFAKHSTADFQRHAIAEMLGQSALRSSMPVEVFADALFKWLTNDINMVDQMIEGIETIPQKPDTMSLDTPLPVPCQGTSFYYGSEGRRRAMRHMMKIIKAMEEPCSILFASDDNLEWLFEDYLFSREIQADLSEVLHRGFTLYQIMPSANFMNRYVESLRYWLPIYITGQAKIYYYPRLRDNLYRHATIILPGHCVQASTGIGLENHNQITLVSTDTDLVKAYTKQYQEHLSICRPALIAHTDPAEFNSCFKELFSRNGFTIQKVTPLSAPTIPKELLELCLRQSESPIWTLTYQTYLEEIPRFEENLKHNFYIDICRLATVEEVCNGTVPIASPCKTTCSHPCYTKETYILHLKNILRLMDEYENYYFLPSDSKEQQYYNLIVNANGLALLIRTAPPVLMLEMRRPEMVQASQEYLLRMAEKIGYDGIHRRKIYLQIQDLIHKLQEA